MSAELPVINNLRTRLLALRLLDTVLPSNTDLTTQPQPDFFDQRQIVDALLSIMSDAVWTSPVPEAIAAVTRQMRQMEATIAELSASDCLSVGVHVSAESCFSSTDIADVSFDVDKILNCTVENGHTLIHGAGGRGYGLAGIPISSGCYQWKVQLDVLYQDIKSNNPLTPTVPIWVESISCQNEVKLSFAIFDIRAL